MIDEILKEAETFKNNMSNSVIEIEQIALSLDIVLEHIETSRIEDKNFKRAVSLLEVLIRSLSDCYQVSEDSVMLFEQLIFKFKQKNKLTTSANEVSNS